MPSLAYRTTDNYYCTHLTTAYQSREPIVDIGSTDAVVPTSIPTYFPDLQMLPATAGGVVPIYNIPELAALGPSSPLVLSRTSIALIFLGQIKYWNDSRILADNTGAVKTALATVASPILPVVRADSSGTTSIFANALSSFSSTFLSEVGASTTPPWCTSLTDEVQVITITGCSSSQTVQLTTMDPKYLVRQVSFACDASVSTLVSLFKTSGRTNVTISQSVSGTTVALQVGYSDSSLIKKNWYRPIVSSVGSGASVSIRTLQEGGYLNAPYSGTSSTTLLTQSIFIFKNSSSAAAFNFNLTLTTASGSVVAHGMSTASSIPALNSALIAAISAVVPSGYLANVTHTSRASYTEFKVQFSSTAGATTYISGWSSAFARSGASAGANIEVFELLDYKNYPIFTSNSLYTCYKRSLNYQPFSFYTGSLNPGVIAVVSTT
jgi:hypothetical protein